MPLSRCVPVSAPLIPLVALVKLPPLKNDLSKSTTRPPFSKIVVAADIPAEPPPTTMAWSERIAMATKEHQTRVKISCKMSFVRTTSQYMTQIPFFVELGLGSSDATMAKGEVVAKLYHFGPVPVTTRHAGVARSKFDLPRSVQQMESRRSFRARFQ